MQALGFVILSFHILGLLSSIAAIMNTRTSQGSIAWATSLNTFPYLAVPAYWIFGRNRFNGYVASKRELADSIDEFGDQVFDEVRAHTIPDNEKNAMMRAAETLVDFPILENNAVELLIDGEKTFASIFQGIAMRRKVCSGAVLHCS